MPRYTLTRREAAVSLGVSINHFERNVQPELKVVLSGQLVLIPVAELERWVQSHAHVSSSFRCVAGRLERFRGSAFGSSSSPVRSAA